MHTWTEYCRAAGYLWVNEETDEVSIKYEPSEDQYHVRYRPAISDITTTVPNGRKDAFEDAVRYACDVVMGADRVDALTGRDLPRTGSDAYEQQIRSGDHVDPDLLSTNPRY